MKINTRADAVIDRGVSAMARRRRKVNTETLDTKIEQQKAVLEKAKAKYEAEKETLADLIKLRNEMRKEELMEAVIKSDHSYAEIMAFIKGTANEEL
jgi:hypothetical protein